MKVLCVGRNYARHVKEMGAKPSESPVWFWKPDTAVVQDGDPVVVPPGIGAVHHEVELAVRVGKSLRRASASGTLRHVDAATVAVDVTARDLQDAAKKAGAPWDQSKGFDTFLPLGPWHPFHAGLDLQDLRLRLSVNGRLRQDGTTRDMTWPVAELLAMASQWTTLAPGDVLLTGTPEGVGPIVPGDAMEAEVVGVARVRNPVAGR